MSSVLVLPNIDEQWTVYVDETYLNQMQKIVTSFWAVKKQNEKDIFAQYKNLVYAADTKDEAKSTMVSDFLNTQALSTTQGHAAVYVISSFDTSQIDQNHKEEKKFRTAVSIYAYLMPLDRILKQIKYKTANKQNVAVKVIIDRLENFEPGSPFSNYASYFLDKIAQQNNSARIKFLLSWGMEDSKKSIGIQIADMMCGAYRKEKMYQKFQPDVRLIPFKYEKFNANEDLFHNPTFLQTYALVRLLPEMSQPKIKTDQKNEEIIEFHPQLHLVNDFSEINSLIESINQNLKLTSNKPLTKKIQICNVLHACNKLLFSKTKGYLKLRKKYESDKSCQLVITNFEQNLVKLQRLVINSNNLSFSQLFNNLSVCLDKLEQAMD